MSDSNWPVLLGIASPETRRSEAHASRPPPGHQFVFHQASISGFEKWEASESANIPLSPVWLSPTVMYLDFGGPACSSAPK